MKLINLIFGKLRSLRKHEPDYSSNLTLHRPEKRPYKPAFNTRNLPVYRNEEKLVEKTQRRLDKISGKRKYRLGTLKVDKYGRAYKYAKIDFGVVGKDAKTGKVYRNIQYNWLPYR